MRPARAIRTADGVLSLRSTIRYQTRDDVRVWLGRSEDAQWGMEARLSTAVGREA